MKVGVVQNPRGYNFSPADSLLSEEGIRVLLNISYPEGGLMIYNVENGETVYEQDGCKGVRLYATDGIEYVHLSIKPGGKIPEHSLPLSVSFYVLRGCGICSVSGGKPFSATKGDMLECPPNMPRGWRNASDEPLELLVIKRVGANVHPA
jgi:quercetin dioxygenase-like cupin family protein